MRVMQRGLSLGAVSALVVSLMGGATLADTKLIYGSFAPEGHVAHQSGLIPMFKEVEAATDGSLTFELFVGGAMGGAKSMLPNVRDGVTDAALIADAYFKSDLPASAALTDYAVLGSDPLVMADATNEMHLLGCPACLDELERNNVHPLAYYATAPYLLMCTKPIEDLGDLAGRKVRATGAFAPLAAKLGGTPVSISAAEMYEALERGQADCTLGAAAHLISYSLKDVITDIVDMPLGTFNGTLAMSLNTDSWDRLDKDQQAALTKAMPALVSRVVFAYLAESEQAFSEAKELGAQVRTAGADMVTAVDEHRAAEYDRVVQDANAAGLENAAATFEAYVALLEKWTGIVASVHGDPAKYEQALWDEIYSKLAP